MQKLEDFEHEALVHAGRISNPGIFLPASTGSRDIYYAGYVLGTVPLGGDWWPAMVPFLVESDARAFLMERGFGQNQQMGAWQTLSASGSGALTIDSLAHKMFIGELWCLPVYIHPFENPGLGLNRTGRLVLTSPDACNALNTQLGTKVDFQFISRMEGGQWQRGYIPFGRQNLHGHRVEEVLGHSGVTIGSGFDLGQQDEKHLRANGFDDWIIDVLQPYLGRKFAGYTRYDLFHEILRSGPMPMFRHKNEVDYLDQLSFQFYAQQIMQVWQNSRVPKAVKPGASGTDVIPTLKNFVDLSSAWQTVLVDYDLSRGRGHFQSSAFGKAMLEGDAKAAKTALAGETVDPHRRQAELSLVSGDNTDLSVSA
jgi:hypothetical protein